MEADARRERARLLAADQALQALLLNFGLVEDWEQRILDELAQPDDSSAEDSRLSHSMTLRHMRRTGPLGELDESVQSTLLGSTLYQYSRGAPAVRAAAPRQRPPLPESTLDSTTLDSTTSVLGATQASLGEREGSGGRAQALTNLRRTVERLLHGTSFGGTSAGGSDLSSTLASSVAALQGHAASGPDLGSTVGLLEGHLSPLDETSASVGDGFHIGGGHLSPLDETSASVGDGFHINGGSLGQTQESGLSGVPREAETQSLGQTGESVGAIAVRDPALETADSWAYGGGRFLDETGRTVLSGSMANLEEGDRTGLLMRLINNADFDESLVRSVRRVLQLGSLLTGNRLSVSEIDDLPKVHFEQKEEQQCSICLEAFDTGELLTQLPCDHFFHVDCISRWFQQSTQCPLCRGEVGDT